MSVHLSLEPDNFSLQPRNRLMDAHRKTDTGFVQSVDDTGTCSCEVHAFWASDTDQGWLHTKSGAAAFPFHFQWAPAVTDAAVFPTACIQKERLLLRRQKLRLTQLSSRHRLYCAAAASHVSQHCGPCYVNYVETSPPTSPRPPATQRPHVWTVLFVSFN